MDRIRTWELGEELKDVVVTDSYDHESEAHVRKVYDLLDEFEYVLSLLPQEGTNDC